MTKPSPTLVQFTFLDPAGEHCAMFHNEKLNDVNCNRQLMFVCKMKSRKDGFKNELKLSDHLYNIEKDIIDVKMNLTILNEILQNTTTSTTQTSTTTRATTATTIS